MLGPGTKCAAAFSQPAHTDVTNESLTALVTAWCALLNGGSPSSAMAELTALAPHLGIKRMHASTSGGNSMGTLSALATALAPLVWPDRYTGIMLAVGKYNGGKQESTCKLHYSKVNKLVQALGGIEAVRGAVNKHQASLSVVSRSDMSCAGTASASMSTLMPLHVPLYTEQDWASDMLSSFECMAHAPWVDMPTNDALVELDCAYYHSRTPSPAPCIEGLPLELDSLLMISTEEQWECPPGTVVDGNVLSSSL